MNSDFLTASGITTVAEGVWGRKHVLVNFYMLQNESNDKWVLVDAGLKWSAPVIRKMAASIFGEGSKPECIILTHGHFDHVGAVESLAEEWDVPVYAHYMELPYLTGKSSYPPPDPTVGGGLMSAVSFTYPKSPINIWNRVTSLPSDGSVPGLPEWKYIHTPGHTPGHISLYRPSDKVLIAGDAFVTTRTESAIAVLLQTKKVSGPPKYFTMDWDAARSSVSYLASLQPKIAATGHGQPMKGAQLRDALIELNQHFENVAVPGQGRYMPEPAIADTNGIVYIPARHRSGKGNGLLVRTAAVTAGIVCALVLKRNKKVNRLRQHEYLLDFEYNF